MSTAAVPKLPGMAELIPPVFGYAIFQITGSISRLGIPDALGDGSGTAEELAAEVGADLRFLQRLLRAGAAAGLLTTSTDGRFALTELGRMFRKDAPWLGYAHDATHAHPMFWEAWGALENAVRTGIPAFDLVHGKGLFDHLAGDPELSSMFHLTMSTGTALQVSAIVDGYDFSPYRRVTDVGGGDGTNLSAILNANPGVSGVVFDRANALQDAPAVLEKAGVADRCETVAGDFFDTVPAGSDLYVLKSVVHDWNDEAAEKLLSTVRAAMEPDSKLVVFTWLMPEKGDAGGDPAERLAMAVQDIELMVVTRGEMRTLSEYTELFGRAGLSITSVLDIPCPFSLHAIEAERAG
ncbi:methyltransferase [Amycolatopsis ultiminotia]|uniref:Methyltransferase n=1 Tax=Amycolatopsis ultiminotia TaxID=543629 RepID=A0ABP6YG38_9PSEU